MQYVLSLSYGKDSMACLGAIWEARGLVEGLMEGL